MITRSAVFLAFVATVLSDSRADTLVQSATQTGVVSGSSAVVAVPRFDPSLGALTLVRVTVALRPHGTVGLENTGAAPVNYSGGWYTPYWHTFSASFGVTGLATSASSNAGYAPPPMSLTAYDGTTDYAGTSGATHVANGVATDGTSGTLTFNSAAAFDARFAGAGNVNVVVGPMLLNTYWEGGVPPPPGVVTQSTGWNADVEVSVRYDYAPHPTALCTPGSTLCPCDNLGGAGAGCANSANGAGALLATSGTASLANDTLVLDGTRMTNSSALYFQGTSFQHAPSVYGDGLRCVVGTVVRLGTRTNVAGSSSVPSAGGTPISVAGGVTAPGTRFYQIIYRDNGAFCTSSTFNAANGVSVVWAP